MTNRKDTGGAVATSLNHTYLQVPSMNLNPVTFRIVNLSRT